MKIAISTDEWETISYHFSRTKGFAIFEVEGNKIKSLEYRPNVFFTHTRGLDTMSHVLERYSPILNIIMDCEVVISNGMEKCIYDHLKRRGIEVYVTNETNVKNALDLYLSHELIDNSDIGCGHND
ncbi:MAG: hypothetical protein KAT48_13135 [Bacteroidales bacterium]|nr:hypothetical protein [Bacteroidales bacterium]